ncbi:hypothetical protein HMPREF1578_00420 [Gardnerella pickettii JCP8017B]|nr:hypothetical protein HMPREF1578_00420 [Gardnerella pickettii JCP8017B]
MQKELGCMQKAKLTSSISRIFISLALHTFWPITQSWHTC